MKKRAKLIAVVSSFCLCLSLLVMGIFAATSVTFSVTSSLSFKANGAFVKVDAQLRQGQTAGDATLQGDAPDTYSYKVYSYNRQDGSDLPDGSATLNNFVNASGEVDPSWDIGDIQFTDKLPVVVYHFEYTNYSPVPVVVTATSNISTLQSEMSGTITIVENYSNGNVLAAYTGSSPSTTVYTITVELEKFTTGFSDKSLSLDVNFSSDLPVNREYFTYSGTTITGLSNTYKNLPTKPDVLVVPGYSESGEALILENKIEQRTYEPVFTGLESATVILQEGITIVGDSAFKGCSALQNIILPQSLIEIEDESFRDTGLKSIIIPENVKLIDGYAFWGCSSLSSVIIKNTEDWLRAYYPEVYDVYDSYQWSQDSHEIANILVDSDDYGYNPEHEEGWIYNFVYFKGSYDDYDEL